MKTTSTLMLCLLSVAGCADKNPPNDITTRTTSAETVETTTVPGTSTTTQMDGTNPSSSTTRSYDATNGSGAANGNGKAYGTAPSTNGSSVNGVARGPEPVAPPPPPEADANKGAMTATDGNIKADNTKLNERDKSGKTLTPMDQGTSKSDIDITAKIRRGVVGDGSLSMTAKNVKIITRDGHVTLRGPVKTETERAWVENFAKNVAGVNQVDNQLEVKK